MGAAIDALRPAVAVTRENPVFLAASLLVMVVSVLASVLAGRIPVVGELVNSLLVTPAFAALLLGMAFAGLATDAASLGDGVESLRSSYGSLVGAYAVLIGAVLLVVVGWAVEMAVAVVVWGGVDPTASMTPATLQPAIVAVRGPILTLSFLALAIVLIGGLAIQFFDVAIVVGGASALESFGASWRLFREAPGSVIGYSVLRLLPIVGAGGLVAGAYLGGSTMLGSIGAILAAVVAAAVVGPVTFAFATAYHVAYYEARVGTTPSPDGAVTATGPAAPTSVD
jgi:hypothetical protein